MKNFESSKKIVVGLIVVWCIFLLMSFIPTLLSSIQDIHRTTLTKISIYEANIYMQEYIYYSVIIGLISIFFLLLICLFSSICLFYRKYMVYLGIVASIQTIFIALLSIWKKYLVNSCEEKLIVDLKTWVMLSIVLIFVISIFIIKRKWFNFLFIISTLIQFINTCFLVKHYFLALSHFNVLFFCFYGLVIYVLYWALLILDKHSRQAKVD